MRRRWAPRAWRGCKPMTWTLALPELVLAICGLVILAAGVIPKQETFFPVSMACVGALLLAAVLVLGQPEGTALGGHYVSDAFSGFMKFLALSAAARRHPALARLQRAGRHGALRIPRAHAVRHARRDGHDLGQRPALALSRARAAVAAALCARRLQPRQRPLGRGRAEVLRARRARLRPAALWQLAGLRLRRHHQFRPPGRGLLRAERRLGRRHRRRGLRHHRPGLQGLGGALPHVDAGRLRRRADPGDRLLRLRAQGRGHRAAGPRAARPLRRPRGAVAAGDRAGLAGLDDPRRLRRHRAEEPEAPDGLFLDRPCRLRADGPRGRQRHRAARPAGLHGDLCLHEPRHLRGARRRCGAMAARWRGSTTLPASAAPTR